MYRNTARNGSSTREIESPEKAAALSHHNTLSDYLKFLFETGLIYHTYVYRTGCHIIPSVLLLNIAERVRVSEQILYRIWTADLG